MTIDYSVEFNTTLKRILPPLLVLCAIGTLLQCSNPDNPFANLSNARVHVIDRDFGTAPENDSVLIFKQYTMSMVVSLHENVDSFLVILPGNRRGDTTRFGTGTASELSGEPYDMHFSLVDTGLTEILILTYRSNNDRVVSTLPVRAVSPLSQEAVTIYFGDTLDLQTDSVGDHDVWYWWSLDEFNTIRSAKPRTSITIVSASRPSGSGHLWVTDARGEHASPTTSFSYTILDSIAPAISLFEPYQYVTRGDTLLVPDSSLVFQVRISDPGKGIVNRVTINGGLFDEVSGEVYSEELRSLHMTASDKPLPLQIVAHDISGNQDSASFWIQFDRSVSVSRDARLSFLWPPTNPWTSSSNTQRIFGRVTKAEADSLNLSVSLTVNGSPMPDFALPGTGETIPWETQVALAAGPNTVNVVIADSSRRLALDTTLAITYSPLSRDTIAPVIADVWVGDAKEFSRAYTTDDHLDMRIIAFDQGTGIESIRVNDAITTPDPGRDYLWVARIPLAHHQGNALMVIATDNNDNSDTLSGLVYSNKPPVVLNGLQNSTPLYTHDTFRDTLEVYDANGDEVVIVGNTLPPGAHLEGTTFSWAPQDSQTGQHEIALELFDGFQTIPYTCTLMVLPALNSPCSLHILSPAGLSDNDTVSFSETDSALQLTVQILDPDPPSIEYHRISIRKGGLFSVQAMDTTRVLSVRIDPTRADNLTERLQIIAEDREGTRDSLSITLMYPSGQISPYQQRVTLSSTTLGLSDTLFGFPLLLRLDSSNFDFSSASPRGTSIRFTSETNSALPFEIERWDTINNKADIWVRLDTIYPDRDPVFLLTTSPEVPRPEAPVFSGTYGFAGVWHGDSSLHDASDNSYHAINKGLDFTEGAIGWGMNLDGINDYATIGRNTKILSSVSSVTLSGWVYQKNYNQPGYQAIIAVSIESSNSTDISRASISLKNGGQAGIFARVEQSSPNIAHSDSIVSLDSWHHIVGVIDYARDSLKLYVDGHNVAKNGADFSLESTPVLPSWMATIGAQDNGTYEYFDGLLDEIRIERVVRSPEWIRLSYENQRPGSSLLTFEAEN